MSYWFVVMQGALTGNLFISAAVVSLLVFYEFCSPNLTFR